MPYPPRKYRRTLAEQIVGEAEAWREVFVVGAVETGGATRRSHLLQRSSVGGSNPVEQVILLGRHAKVVPTYAKVQRQPGGPAEAVLQVQPVIVFILVPIGVAGCLAPTGRQAFEERREIREGQLAAEIGVLNDLNRGAAKFVAELHIVTADLPRIVVDEVPVGIHPLPGHTGRSAELGKASDGNQRQSAVKGRCAGIQSNRGGIEVAGLEGKILRRNGSNLHALHSPGMN